MIKEMQRTRNQYVFKANPLANDGNVTANR